MLLAWVCLLAASVAEVWWTIALKYSKGLTVFWPAMISIAGMIVSVLLLAYASRTIPIGTAYAVWSGLGAALTVIGGIVLFHEPRDAARLGVCRRYATEDGEVDRIAESRRRDAPNSSAIWTFRQRRVCDSRPSQPTEFISDRLLACIGLILAGVVGLKVFER